MKLKDIDKLLPEKKEVIEYIIGVDNLSIGYNQAIDQIQSSGITLNCERLKEILIDKHSEYWDENSDSFRGVIEEICDAIIQSLDKLVEVER